MKYVRVEMAAGDVPELQRFLEANPEYYLAVSGAAPSADAAREAFESLPPAPWPYERKWMFLYRDREGAIAAMVDVIEDLLADDVWHVGLFIVATSLHGSGAAGEIYRELEAWMTESGARWARLGVVKGNARAERFWEKAGYREVRVRTGIASGKRVNDIRVMVKTLASGASLRDYLDRVPRDRPESA